MLPSALAGRESRGEALFHGSLSTAQDREGRNICSSRPSLWRCLLSDKHQRLSTWLSERCLPAFCKGASIRCSEDEALHVPGIKPDRTDPSDQGASLQACQACRLSLDCRHADGAVGEAGVEDSPSPVVELLARAHVPEAVFRSRGFRTIRCERVNRPAGAAHREVQVRKLACSGEPSMSDFLTSRHHLSRPNPKAVPGEMAVLRLVAIGMSNDEAVATLDARYFLNTCFPDGDVRSIAAGSQNPTGSGSSDAAEGACFCDK